MHFYQPRRYRRKLLFPPGLLALAGLLWLGCVALRPWQDALKRRSVLQLIVVPLHPSSIWDGSPLLSLSKINAFRPWRDAILEGNKKTSARLPQRAFITNVVRTMMADSAHAGGVRIHFASSTQYSDFIFVLDLLKRENVKQYWLDNRRGPATFYAFTEVRLRMGQGGIPELICGCCNSASTPSPVPFWDGFDNMVVSFWQFTWVETLLQQFGHPEWRSSLWLLASIAGLRGWKMWHFRSIV